MTGFDIAVPAIALSLGIAAALYARWEAGRVEERLRRDDRPRRPRG